MSLFVTIDGVPQGDVATNSGWFDFVNAIDTIEGVDNLRHLTHYAWSDLPEHVMGDIERVKRNGLTHSQASILAGLSNVLADVPNESVVVITDGSGETEEDVPESFLDQITDATRQLWERYP